MGWFPTLAETQRTARDLGTSTVQIRRTFALSRLYWIEWPKRYTALLLGGEGPR